VKYQALWATLHLSHSRKLFYVCSWRLLSAQDPTIQTFKLYFRALLAASLVSTPEAVAQVSNMLLMIGARELATELVPVRVIYGQGAQLFKVYDDLINAAFCIHCGEGGEDDNSLL